MAAAFIFLGVGFDEKVLFIWIIIALIFAFIIFRPKFDLSKKNIVIMVACFLGGAILFFVRWAIFYERYLFVVSSQTVNPERSGSNAEIIQNLVSRFDQVFELLGGASLGTHFTGSFSNDSFAIFFFLSIVGILLIAVIKRDRFYRKSLFLVFIFFVIISLSIFTVTSRNVSSLIILLPICSMIMAVFLVTITEKIKCLKKGQIISPILFLGILTFLLIGNVALINDYKVQAEKTGGQVFSSVHFIDAGRFLLEQNFTKVTTFDFYLEGSIYVSIDGKLDINHLSMTDNTEQNQLKRYKDNFRGTLNEPEMVYLKFNEKYLWDERWRHMDILNKILDEENKKFITIKTFVDWNGENHTTIYKAVNKE